MPSRTTVMRFTFSDSVQTLMSKVQISRAVFTRMYQARQGHCVQMIAPGAKGGTDAPLQFTVHADTRCVFRVCSDK